MSSLKLSVGTAVFSGPENLQPALDALKAFGIKAIDSAEMYGNNEADLGAVGAASQGFVISTKNPGGWQPGALRDVADRFNASLKEKLKVTAVDILHVHAPDRTLKLDDWVPAIDDLHRQGKYKRLGVSNFSPEEVRELHAYCKSRGYVLPTVYQGNYNAVSRAVESTLFPVLRELGIAFHAYSPVAGGFLTKSRKALEAGTEGGRFAEDGNPLAELYRSLYLKPALLEGLGKWEQLSEEEGVPKAELAYRWVYYHSALKLDEKHGDIVIIGASRVEQIKQTVEGLQRGPLKPEVVKGIEEIWELVKDDAIVDNYKATRG